MDCTGPGSEFNGSSKHDGTTTATHLVQYYVFVQIMLIQMMITTTPFFRKKQPVNQILIIAMKLLSRSKQSEQQTQLIPSEFESSLFLCVLKIANTAFV